MAETSSTTAELGRLLSGSRLADLTLAIAENLPCWWPTHLPFQHKIWAFFLFLPLKVRGSTGGCGRAVAVLA